MYRRTPVAVDGSPVSNAGLDKAVELARLTGDWRADLIVIGTHGRRGVGRVLLGSDAEQVARTAPVPVLLVRANAAP